MRRLAFAGALLLSAATTAGAYALLLIAACANAADVLIIQHGYDGTIEQAGVLVRWQYTGGRMLVEWSDTTTDGIFRNNFED